MSRFPTFFLAACLAVLGLAGCATWDNAPDGATGLLVVSNASLVGSVDGVPIDAGRVRASGYCTAVGWHVELRATAGGRDLVNTLEVRDLRVLGRDAEVFFAPAPDASTELAVRDGVEAGRMSLESCLGDPGSPDFLGYATDVSLKLAPLPNEDVGVEYTASFESGEVVRGQFDMEMPVVD